MVKSYLKFEHAKSFGVVVSSTANLVWTPKGTSKPGTGHSIVAANEQVLCWDNKTGELLSTWRDGKCRAAVTSIRQSRTDRDVFAVGYDDGSVRLWDSKIASVLVVLNGHKSAVTHLAFDRAGLRLASGSRDTDVIVWDIVAEVGLYKLRGHKDQITGLEFIEPDLELEEEGGAKTAVAGEGSQSEGLLLTTGKDALIKVWDLSTRHCVETHVAQANGECWALGVSPDASGCITAGNDGELKVWSVDAGALPSVAKGLDPPPKDGQILRDLGTLHRPNNDKATEVIFHPKKDYFAVHGTDKAVEVWRIRTDAEVRRSLARKRRRRREKAAEKGGGLDDEEPADGDQVDPVSKADITERFAQHVIVRTGGKVRGIDWALSSSRKEVCLVVATTNNQIEYYSILAKDGSDKTKRTQVPDYNRALSIELPGHRTDIRALSVSSDDKMLASAANGGLKIWNIRTQSCIRTFECGYALCCSFLPGDKVVVVGTKSGELQLFDVASAALVEGVAAHEGAIWSLQVHPDGRSVVSGSADKTAKFWNFQIVQAEVLGTSRTTPRLTLVHTRTLKLSDDILSVRFSPDARLVAVALLDSTVKVFFVDSLKLYLNLYGHKLPVLSMDISWDSKLIVTSSADKNIRIWGLDFGDCHKALFGHQDSILQVAFIPHNSDSNGHHFFSAGKDRTIKYWDGDKFEQVQRLDGHHGEIWAMAISHSGQMLITASHDKSIRVWDETDEQIFLEEERERELEELYENTLATSLQRDPDADDDGPDGAEAVPATKQTTETLMAGERIQEALELGMADLGLLQAWEEEKRTNPRAPAPQRSIVFLALGNITAERHVLSVLQGIKAAALHDALLVLSFATVPALLTFLGRLAARGMNIPLTCRVLFFILRTHHMQIVASKSLRALLGDVRTHLRTVLARQKAEMGVNLAALRVVDMLVRERGEKQFVDGEDEVKEENTRKRAFVHLA